MRGATTTSSTRSDSPTSTGSRPSSAPARFRDDYLVAPLPSRRSERAAGRRLERASSPRSQSAILALEVPWRRQLSLASTRHGDRRGRGLGLPEAGRGADAATRCKLVFDAPGERPPPPAEVFDLLLGPDLCLDPAALAVLASGVVQKSPPPLAPGAGAGGGRRLGVRRRTCSGGAISTVKGPRARPCFPGGPGVSARVPAPLAIAPERVEHGPPHWLAEWLLDPEPPADGPRDGQSDPGSATSAAGSWRPPATSARWGPNPRTPNSSTGWRTEFIARGWSLKAMHRLDAHQRHLPAEPDSTRPPSKLTPRISLALAARPPAGSTARRSATPSSPVCEPAQPEPRRPLRLPGAPGRVDQAQQSGGAVWPVSRQARVIATAAASTSSSGEHATCFLRGVRPPRYQRELPRAERHDDRPQALSPRQRVRSFPRRRGPRVLADRPAPRRRPRHRMPGSPGLYRSFLGRVPRTGGACGNWPASTSVPHHAGKPREPSPGSAWRC